MTLTETEPKRTASTRARTRLGRILGFVAPFPLFFATLLLMTIPHGARSVVSVYNLPLLTSSAAAVKSFGASDAGSLLTAAMSLRARGGINTEVWWVYNLWPPGMIGVDRVLLSVETHFHIPIVLSMVLLNCAVWAIFLGVVFTVIRSMRGLFTAVLFAAGAFLYSGVNARGVRTGLFYSDSFGAMAFCLSLLFLVLLATAKTRRRRIVFSVLSGVFLAAACFFRASFELVADATLVICLILLVIVLIARRFGRMPRFTGAALPTLTPLVIMAAATQVLLTPWRLYAGTRIHPGDFRWSTVSDLTSAARWIPDKILLQTGAGFAAEGHSNWACINDRVECAKIYAVEKTAENPYSASIYGHYTGAQFDHLTIQSILKHPFNYIFERIDALAFGFASNTGGAVKDLALPESIILASLAIAIVVMLIRARNFTNPAYLFFFFAMAIQFATLALIHMEPRYFLGIELSIIVIAPFALLDRKRILLAKVAE